MRAEAADRAGRAGPCPQEGGRAGRRHHGPEQNKSVGGGRPGFTVGVSALLQRPEVGLVCGSPKNSERAQQVFTGNQEVQLALGQGWGVCSKSPGLEGQAYLGPKTPVIGIC